MELSNKVAVVTGGSSGIGLAIAKTLHQHGAKLSLFGRDSHKLQTAATALKNSLAISGDVSNLANLDHLFHETHSKLGGIDILIANAGIAETRHVKDVDEPFFDRLTAINYKGLYFTVQRSLPYLNPGASIVLISSAVAHMTWPTHSVYASGKAAISSLAKSFASDLIERNIRVNAISPGFVDTPMFDERKKNSPQMIQTITSNIPAKRFGRPEEIAQAALFLCTCPYMIGADLVIDGGLSVMYTTKM